jgi:acyl-CoA thioesterase
MTVADTMINGHGLAHGGYVFLLADTAFAVACNTYDEAAVARACDIVFLRPAKAGDELVATAVERTRLRRSGIYDVTVRRGDGEVVAELRGQSATLAPRDRT